MKNLYIFLGIVLCFLVIDTGYSQVLLKEDFEEGDLPTGWNSVGFIPTTTNACDGWSLRRHFQSSGGTSGNLESPSQTSEGADIEISFEYKIIDESTGDATEGDFGSLALQYSTDGGDSYSTYYTIDKDTHTASSSCTVLVNTISGSDVPDASEFRWRLDGTWNEGDYYVYIDNFSMIEQTGCIEPYEVEVMDITTEEVTVDWEDIGEGYDSWDITYVDGGLPASFGTTVNTTSHPYTITGLTEGKEYDIYVTANCDDGGESNQVGPVTFKTIAIGSSCEFPLEIESLPYSHVDQDTEHYGNNYEGSAGAGCGSDGSYLDGYDVVYHYTSEKDDVLQIDLSNLSESYTGVFVYTDCEDIGNEDAVCFGASTGSDKEDHGIVNLFVDEGEDYYIVVSSWPQVGGAESFEYDLNIEGFECSDFEAPTGDATQEFIAGQDLSNLDVDPTIAGANLTWYSDSGLTTEIPETTSLVDGTTYYLTQTLGDCESESLAILVEEFDCASELEITDVVVGDGACDSGKIEFEASANKEDNIYWWDAEEDGEIVHIGPEFTTPELDETTSYWVSETFLGEGEVTGQANPGPSGIQGNNMSSGVTFTLKKEITLVDVEVYNVGSSGGLLVSLKGTPDDTSLPEINESFSQSILGGSTLLPMPNTVEIGYKLPAGTYTLEQTSSLNLSYETGADFPFAIGTSGEVTDENFGSYYYFYNWTILEERPICESDRIEVEAVVHPIIPIELSVSEELVCIGSDTEIIVDTDNEDYTFEVTWDNGNESDTNFDDNTISVSPTENTTYTVIATDTVTGCETTEEISVEVKEVPAELEMAPAMTTVCFGKSIELFAGGIGEDFEEDGSGSLDWSIEDNSSSSEAEWELVESPYESREITSNDNSQFYISKSEDLGAGETVDAALVSSSFSLVSTEDAFIEFYHQYRHHPTTSAEVDVSIDGGDSWETLITYTENRGKTNEFKRERVELSDYTGNSDVKIRFRYSGGWGWWWALDNVTIAREYVGGITWSPTTDLYLDEAATIAYDGSPTSSVYYSGSEQSEATYTATLTVEDCGEVSGSIDVLSQYTEPPVADAHQTLVEGSLVSDLEVEGENLFWYEDEDGRRLLSEEEELEDEGIYYVSQTLNGCESEVISITVTIVPLSQSCPSPSELSLEELGSSSAIITWEEPEDTEEAVVYYYYELLYSADSTLIEEGKILTATELIWLEELEDETDYEFRLYAVCDAKLEIYSDPYESLIFTTEDLGVDELNFENFSYYPNPTDRELTLSNSTPINQVDIYDLQGRRVLSKQVDSLMELKVDLSDFASGVYIGKVIAGDGEKTIKIIKK